MARDPNRCARKTTYRRMKRGRARNDAILAGLAAATPTPPPPPASPVIDMGAWGTGIPWEWHPSWATSSGPTSNWGTGTGWGDPNGSGWGDGTGWGEPFANTWGAAAAAGTSTGNWGGLASAASSASN